MMEEHGEEKPAPLSGFRVARILGIEIVINPTWLVIFVLVAISFGQLFLETKVDGVRYPGGALPWIFGALTAIVFFFGLLLHELAHSYVAKRNGVEIGRITLFIFGGAAEMSEELPTAAAEFKTAIAGPIVTFLISGVFFGLYALTDSSGWGPLLVTPLFYLAWVNLSIGIFNLLPGFPLDGGRILRAILWKLTGNMIKATRIATYFGRGVGVLLICAGVVTFMNGNLIGGIWFILIGIFLDRIARESYRQTVLKVAASEARVEDIMYLDVPFVDIQTPLTSLRSNYFGRYNLPAFPVCREGEVVGIVTRTDLLEVSPSEWEVLSTERIMRPLRQEQFISPDTPIEKVLKPMFAGEMFFLVVSDGKIRGLLTRDEVIRFIEARARRIEKG
ncbi:MAG: site-2 protease family protein [Actinomycetota bacterium]|nr:site-2 protease family protein [Actinomycetota bacterium]